MDNRVHTACLLLLSTVAVGAALYWLRPIMIPFVLALVISLGLSALIDWQREVLRIPAALTTMTTVVFAILMFAGLAVLISTSVGQLAASAPLYNAKMQSLAERLVAALPETVRASAQLEALTTLPAGTLGSMLLQTTNAISTVLSQSVLVLIFVAFLMIGERRRRIPTADDWWSEVERRVKRYLVTKVALSAVTGFLVTAVLAILGVDLAAVFGLFAFLLNFIPSIGSIIATLLPVPVVLVSPTISPTAAVLAIAVPGVMQFLLGNVLEPKLMGESLDLHPVTILLALMLWGALWGIVGMLLAVPITASLKILFERIDATRAVADLLAGRLSAAGG
jgi:AI-2 transport protein TqsA